MLHMSVSLNTHIWILYSDIDCMTVICKLRCYNPGEMLDLAVMTVFDIEQTHVSRSLIFRDHQRIDIAPLVPVDVYGNAVHLGMSLIWSYL